MNKTAMNMGAEIYLYFLMVLVENMFCFFKNFQTFFSPKVVYNDCTDLNSQQELKFLQITLNCSILYLNDTERTGEK